MAYQAQPQTQPGQQQLPFTQHDARRAAIVRAAHKRFQRTRPLPRPTRKG